jgi:methylmalonyl-CoA epimerase
MIKSIYGINIAVKDLDEAVKKFESVLGIKSERFKPEEFAFPGLAGAKLNVNGVYINLISYTDENTSVAKFIQDKGEGFFLLSFEVDDIDRDIEDLKSKGLNFVLKETMDVPVGRVNFVHPRSIHGVQLEILEVK